VRTNSIQSSERRRAPFQTLEGSVRSHWFLLVGYAGTLRVVVPGVQLAESRPRTMVCWAGFSD